MDDKTLNAITALAQKLGTTSEYLWSVLLKQAPISGGIDLVVMAVWVAAAVWWFRFVQRKTEKPAASTDNKWPNAEWTDEAAILAWWSVVLFGLVVMLFVGLSMSSTVAAIANPEYWALKQIFK